MWGERQFGRHFRRQFNWIWARVITSQKLPRDSGETIFAARHQSVSQGPLGKFKRRNDARTKKNYLDPSGCCLAPSLGPAPPQNLVVKFDGDICGGVLVENASDNFPPAKEARKSPSKLRRKFATNFAENFANFTLEIAGAYISDWERNLASRCEGVRLLRASGKFPDFPGSSPNFSGSFSATSPEVLSLWNLTAIQGLPGSFPDFPGSSPNFPGGSRTSPEVSTFFWEAWHPHLTRKKLLLIRSVKLWKRQLVHKMFVHNFGCPLPPPPPPSQPAKWGIFLLSFY